MTDIKTTVEELRRLLAAATPGPWDYEREEGGCILWSEGRRERRDDCDVASLVYYPQDAALIAAARNALPGLLDEIERLRRALDEVVGERDFLVSEYERAVKCGKQGFAHAAAHVYNAVVNAKCDVNAERFLKLTAEIERLRGALECLRRDAEAALAHQLAEGRGMQAGVPAWANAPRSLLIAVKRTTGVALRGEGE